VEILLPIEIERKRILNTAHEDDAIDDRLSKKVIIVVNLNGGAPPAETQFIPEKAIHNSVGPEREQEVPKRNKAE